MSDPSLEKGPDLPKGLLNGLDSQLSDDDATSVAVIDWTEEEERKVIRKIDFLLLPVLAFGFFTLQLNRGNIGNALTNGFLQDVGITQNQFNVGQQLLAAGIVIFEIPSNLILYRVGPTLWIGSQIIAWSFVGMFQAFQKGYGAFLATRFILGMCESGFIPGSLYIITKWYKTFETGRRFSIHFTGNMAASALGGLLAYGIIRNLDGRAGWAGWQWLFVIEGLLAFTCGLIFMFVIPQDPSNPVSIFGYSYFNERETHILRQRVLLDDKTKSIQAKKHATRGEILQVLTNWRLLPHVFMTLCYLAPVTALGSYTPSLIAGMGYGNLNANAMATVGAWCAIIASLAFGWISDKTKIRGPLVLGGLVANLAFKIANRFLIYSDNKVTRFCVLAIGNSFSGTLHPLHASWMAMNCRTQAERSITMAIHIMGANLSGVAGAQIFRSDDNPPYYPRGWNVIIALTAASVAFVAIANVQYVLLNRLGKKGPGGGKWKI